MRIRIEASENDPYWIIGDPALDEIGQMSQALSDRVQVTRNQQAINGAEWEGVLFRDRKNQRVVFSAMVNRKFESEWDRMDFLSRLAAINAVQQEHVWEGDVWVRLDKPGTSEFREWKLAEAVIGIAGTDLQGAVGLNITYTVSCGGFSGEVRDGTGSLAKLIGQEEGTFGMVIPATELQALVDANTTGTTVDFQLLVETQLTAGAYLAAAKFLVPTGTATGDPEFDLPVASSLSALASALDADFAYPAITNDAGALSIISPTVGLYDYIRVRLYERHDDGYGLVSTLLQTWNAAVIAPDFLLIGTIDGTDHALVAFDETTA